VIFSRGRGTGRHQKPAGATRPGRSRPGGPARPDEVDLSVESDESTDPATQAATDGPYDVTEAPQAERLDLGSLQIPVVEGVDIRVQANPDGLVQQVVLVHQDSLLQLTVLAAPRSTGIWDEIREEIRQSLQSDGVRAEEHEGEFGTELRARVKVQGGGQADLRFIGVDGPRWLVQATYQGRAATDPSAAGPLDTCLRGLVVDRGKDAMPVRDVLPLRLPREMAEQAQAQARAQQAQGGVNGAQPGGASPGGPAAPPRRPR
jgi:uncharacterized protein DUF3710